MTPRWYRLLTAADYARRRALTALTVAMALAITLVVGLQVAQPAAKASTNAPPLAGGFFTLVPISSYASLPNDREAAAMVRYSRWEPRPGNARYNRTMATHLRIHPVSVATKAYDPRWNRYVLARITGRFTGTTDEIFQWAAAKWGLPDNLLRAIAYTESDWRQSNFGDYIDDAAKCPSGYQKLPCPVTFGIVGTKSTSWPGIFPWNRDSTAADVDVLGGWLRGCYEGWVWWLRDHGNRARGTYRADDIWGCVGAWYSGNWHDGAVNRPGGERYLLRVRHWYQVRPWLSRKF